MRAAAAGAALGVLMTGLFGCDAETASGTTTTPGPLRGTMRPAPVPIAAVDPGTPALPPDHVRVTGMVFNAGGKGTTPELPFERGSVVAVPLDRFLAIQQALRPSLIIGAYLQESLALPRRLLSENGVDSGDLELDGTYSLALRPGPYALCLVELGGRRPEGTSPDAFWIERWLEVTVTDVELQTILPVYNRGTGEITVLY
ncbi:MAG: hypothetical protein ACYSU7_04540 [Planctomycetota bacterium]